MTLLIAFGSVLLGTSVLFVLGSGRVQKHQERNETSSGNGPCPPQIIERVFSKRDLDFIEAEASPELKEVYVTERRRVAVTWIRRTSAELGSAMNAHVRAVRTRQDLEAQGEIRIFSQYIGLRCLCGLLLACAFVVPPSALYEIATYASRLSHRFDWLHRGVVPRAAPTAIRFER